VPPFLFTCFQSFTFNILFQMNFALVLVLIVATCSAHPKRGNDNRDSAATDRHYQGGSGNNNGYYPGSGGNNNGYYPGGGGGSTSQYCSNCRYDLDQANYCCYQGIDNDCCYYVNGGGGGYPGGSTGGSGYYPGSPGSGSSGKLAIQTKTHPCFLRRNLGLFWHFFAAFLVQDGGVANGLKSR
jgi:hypothetical protein